MIECIINNMFCLLNLWKSIINSKNIIYYVKCKILENDNNI